MLQFLSYINKLSTNYFTLFLNINLQFILRKTIHFGEFSDAFTHNSNIVNLWFNKIRKISQGISTFYVL